MMPIKHFMTCSEKKYPLFAFNNANKDPFVIFKHFEYRYGALANTTPLGTYPITQTITISDEEQTFSWPSSEQAYHAQKIIHWIQKIPVNEMKKRQALVALLRTIEGYTPHRSGTFLPQDYKDILQAFVADNLSICSSIEDVQAQCEATYHAKHAPKKGIDPNTGFPYTVGFMQEVVKLKIQQHPELAELALFFAEKKVWPIEISQHDETWAMGKDGKGRGLLGLVWMNEGKRLLAQKNNEEFDAVNSLIETEKEFAAFKTDHPGSFAHQKMVGQQARLGINPNQNDLFVKKIDELIQQIDKRKSSWLYSGSADQELQLSLTAIRRGLLDARVNNQDNNTAFFADLVSTHKAVLQTHRGLLRHLEDYLFKVSGGRFFKPRTWQCVEQMQTEWCDSKPIAPQHPPKVTKSETVRSKSSIPAQPLPPLIRFTEKPDAGLIPFTLNYNTYPQSMTQAQMILDMVSQLEKLGVQKVGLTYSANEGQTDTIIKTYQKGGWNTKTNGAHQAQIIAQIETLLQSEAYQHLQGVFRIIPFTTMKYNMFRQIHAPSDEAVTKCLDNANVFIQNGGVILGWRNQSTNEGELAIGGGVAKNIQPQEQKDRIQRWVQGCLKKDENKNVFSF